MQKGRALPPIPQQSSKCKLLNFHSLVDAIGNYHNWTLLPLVEREHLRQGEYIRRGEA
ncbi:MAG: hypothetical protein JGK03_24330 [Microcoleus sp. PH2017_25_DOB_D_A]|uniref:hypothetical protein n=1 Tax=unclassified Microcoleus TaxID=2642155 RepID=UPI001D343B94|nr:MULTISPECIES: hypothetical protein [unclassified Microcoleus]MCC3493980.1 hypothetical protein [Microcoleus sp. PH2017_16_JOR_D_A]MCC3537240.1 hypothetical protein [Microcoleus sp. PH2017_25_DOB_D_A]MCC3549549.1 hypothetical protein [Microcoleus sp. PH2017_24_DOB_U_A]